MQTKTFSININASKEKVWDVLWNDATYKQWTRVFSEGSYAVTDWQEGSKIQFLIPSGDGMYSTIARHVPGQVMSFRHIGEVLKGEEQPPKNWAGATETYTLTESGGTTTLTATMDMAEGEAAYFEQKFPEALQKVKALAEG